MALSMHVMNQTMPNSKQRALLDEPGPEGPIYLINLIKYRAMAEYGDGRDTALTGREAFNLYAEAADQGLAEYNAEMLFDSHLTALFMGEVETLWDDITIVRYGSRRDIMALARSTKWQALNVHREAGIEGQLLIESVGRAAFPG